MSLIGLGMISNSSKTTFYYGNYEKIKNIILSMSEKDKKSRMTVRSLPNNRYIEEYINEIKKIKNINFVEVT